MAYQVCSLCKGSGQLLTNGTTSNPSVQCHVCAGTEIINELTGLPPSGTIVSTPDTGNINLKMMNNMTRDEFIKKLREGGTIVSSNDCSALEIADARACNRMFVDNDGFGYVYRKPIIRNVTSSVLGSSAIPKDRIPSMIGSEVKFKLGSELVDGTIIGEVYNNQTRYIIKTTTNDVHDIVYWEVKGITKQAYR